MKIFNLPDLGEGLAEAEIREWYVKEGDEVKLDQPLVAMETAKALVDVPSPYAGKIAVLHGKPNDIIQTGAPLVTFDSVSEAQQIRDTKNHTTKGSVVGALEESSQQWQAEPTNVGMAKSNRDAVKMMPAARLLAAQMNVDLKTVTASGPQGLITVEDIKQALATHSTSFSSHAITGEKLHGLRRTMAVAMAEAHKQVVAASVIEDADLTDLPPSTDLTTYLLQALVAAVKVEPGLNAWFDGRTLERQLFEAVHVGLAVDTTEGLLVPVIHDADKKSSVELREWVDRYKQSAKTRDFSQADLQGATLTLSNFGTMTGRYATPVVMPPTVAILACGRSRDAAVVRAGKVVVGRIMPLSLTFDHRVITGGEATRFLAAVIAYLQGKN